MENRKEKTESMGVRFKRAWDNHWYHYKLETWLCILLVFCVSCFVVEKVTREEPDVYITYIGSSYIDETFSQRIEAMFQDVITDVNQDGTKKVVVKGVLFNGSEDLMNMQVLQQADVDFMAAKSVLYLIDSFAYETFLNRNMLQPLSTSQGSFDYLDLTENRLLNQNGLHFDGVYLCQRKTSYQDTADDETAGKYQNAQAITEKILEYQ